jgi:hypothetical protein
MFTFDRRDCMRAVQFVSRNDLMPVARAFFSRRKTHPGAILESVGAT